jgi:choline dehydrogenase
MESFEFIVVGAGSAGCVVADRLSAAGHTVLVLEAGGADDDVFVKAPALFAGLFQGPHDWNYNSEPEPGLFGRRVFLPRGKMLGGSSSMNAMIYMRGSRADFDGWSSEYGATGWSYDEVLPHFTASENNAEFVDSFHGNEGGLNVTARRWLSPHADAFIESAVEAGIERNPDFNGAEQEGVGLFQLTAKDGRRCSAADAFLRPALERPQVTLITHATVHRVVVDDGAAVGVVYEHEGALHTVSVEREVILSAGAYNTPQILMLSGIGPAEHLAEVGIPVLIDSPNVGQHLQDHPLTILHWDTDQGDTLSDLADPALFEQWMADGSGKISSAAAEAAVLWKSDESLDSADFQMVFVPGYFWEHGWRRPTTSGLTIALSYNRPTSRGSVRLRSADPSDAPRIVSNLLSEEREVDAVVRAIGLVDRITAGGPLAKALGERVNPGRGVGADNLKDWIRAETQHMYHASCTARIGTPDDGVVDPELRVHGIRGLRVVDASVMPRITSGNTNAPTIMIGERGAAFILDAADEAAAVPRVSVSAV